jgi:hypothetical protein
LPLTEDFTGGAACVGAAAGVAADPVGAGVCDGVVVALLCDALWAAACDEVCDEACDDVCEGVWAGCFAAAASSASPNDGVVRVDPADAVAGCAAGDVSMGLAEILPMAMTGCVPFVTQTLTQSPGQFGPSRIYR